jgi:hypothetical protein
MELLLVRYKGKKIRLRRLAVHPTLEIKARQLYLFSCLCAAKRWLRLETQLPVPRYRPTAIEEETHIPNDP